MHILILLLLLCTSSTLCSQVVLFDSSTSLIDLEWETWSSHRSDSDQPGWYEETWGGTDGNSNVRIYGSCSDSTTGNGSNWLILPGIETAKAKALFIDLTYVIRTCKDSETVPCKETANVHAREFSSQAEHNRFDVKRDFNAASPNFASVWKKRKVLTHTKDDIEQLTFAFNLRNDTRLVRIAYDDNGACTSIMVTKVYYTVCDEAAKNYTVYAATVSSGVDNADNVMVSGKCVPHAVMINGATPYAFCGPAGQWSKHIIGGCECIPGYTTAKENGRRICRACEVGSYKAEHGNGSCHLCPSQAESTLEGSGHCTCRSGYYRAVNESVEAACTQPPSHPSNLDVRYANQTSVELRWDEPSSMGGRKELWYEWQCTKGDCTGVRAHPADRRLVSRVLRLTGLKPDSEYSFNVFAKNKVSELAGDSSIAYRAIDVRTSPLHGHGISMLRVEGEMKGGVQLAWNPPEVTRHISQYEIEISAPSLNTVETRSSAAPSYSASQLVPGVVYVFRVRANVDVWSDWSAPLSYEAGKGVMVHGGGHSIVSEPESTALEAIPAWVLGLSTLLLVLLLVFLLLICRRNNKNRKQMSDLDVLDTYKQDTMTPDYSSGHRPFNDIFRTAKLNAPLIPSYGSSISQPPPYYGGNSTGKFKPYVDPTAYEDPNQALTEFTFDIDPSSVYITEVIGGGEFGDVCMGGLKRSGLSGDGVSALNETETVAIKTLKPGSGGKAKADFLLEASIMGQFCHMNVVRLIGVVTRAEPAMIVTEYMENGSLDHFLRGSDARGEKLGWSRVVDMLRGIAAGMKYLTDKGYVHRDLAARNVLVDSNLTCKIADFGLSRGVDDTAEAEYTTNGGKIPVRWTAPEAITHRKFTAASDVWSFGVLAWEVCSFGERPYWDWTNQKVISEIMSGYRLPAPMDCPASLHRIMMWCWKIERHDRPSFAQLLAILEKYALNPDYIYADSGLLPRHTISTGTMSSSNAYGVVRAPAGSGSAPCPPPPSGSPPTYPHLEDFLRSLGMGHTAEKLNAAGISSVSDLSRRNHLDLLAMGLISEEYHRIRDALIQLQSSRGLSRPELPLSSSTMQRGRTIPRGQEQGFFV